MQLRATLSLAACLLAAWMCGGCGGAAGKVMVETKAPTKEDPNALLLPFEKPDISEITGIEEDEDKGATPAPAPEPKK